MILGVGSDLIDIRRIEKAIARFGDRFLDRIFTETERRRCDRRLATRIESYARRFAAKEAAAKALGTGFRAGVFWRDLGVVNLPSGQPGMRLTGGALKRLEAITPIGMQARLDVTLTDEPPLANVTLANEPGNLGSLTTTIGKQGGNISNLKITNRSTDFFEIMVDIEVADVKHLSTIIAALRATPVINSVERARG